MFTSELELGHWVNKFSRAALWGDDDDDANRLMLSDIELSGS